MHTIRHNCTSHASRIAWEFTFRILQKASVCSVARRSNNTKRYITKHAIKRTHCIPIQEGFRVHQLFGPIACYTAIIANGPHNAQHHQFEAIYFEHVRHWARYISIVLVDIWWPVRVRVRASTHMKSWNTMSTDVLPMKPIQTVRWDCVLLFFADSFRSHWFMRLITSENHGYSFGYLSSAIPNKGGRTLFSRSVCDSSVFVWVRTECSERAWNSTAIHTQNARENPKRKYKIKTKA